MLNKFTKKEVVDKLLSKSLECYDHQEILLSYLYARQAFLQNENDPSALENLVICLFNIKHYKAALQHSDTWFKIVRDPRIDSSANMYFIRGKCLLEMGKYDESIDPFRKATGLFIQLRNQDRVSEIDRILRDELPRRRQYNIGKSTMEKREECLAVKEFLQMQQIPDQPGVPVYILPANWLKRWRLYNEYNTIVGAEAIKEDMEEELEVPDYLGPIDPTDLLDPTFNLIDTNPHEYYTNLQLRRDVEENKDFYLINEQFWNYLYQRYGGIPLPRFTILRNETTVGVEVWLQKINVCLLPLPSKNQPDVIKSTDTVYISKTKTIKELIFKLTKIYLDIFRGSNISALERRLWKLDPNFDVVGAWRRWDARSSFEVVGDVLDEQRTIDESELSDEDKVILEYKIISRWIIASDDVYSKLQRKKEGENGKSYLVLTDPSQFPPGSRKGLTGLQNLGNTCFMNSALQCLSNTYELTQYFLSGEFENDLNVTNPLGTSGKLALAYSDLMRDMWIGTSHSVSPWELKKIIGKFAPQFSGYGQQDSQELLSYLLDGLHEDLNKVKKKPFVEMKDYDGRPDDVIAAESWEFHLMRNRSKIQELMHGQFKSTLVCPDCKKVSITFDPYMMLSLPIPYDEYCKFFLYFIYADSKRIPNKITFNILTNTSYEDIIEKLSQLTKVPKSRIVMALLKENKLVEFIDKNVEAKYISDHPGIPFAYEIPELDDAMTIEDNKKYILKVHVMAEPKAFYESEKTVSFTRLIVMDSNDTFRDIFIKVYTKMRKHIDMHLNKIGMKNPIDIEEKARDVIEREYNSIFADEYEQQWPYKLFIREEPRGQKSKSKPCASIGEFEKVADYLRRNGLYINDISFDLKFTKTVKIENLGLNQCCEFNNKEDDSLNTNRNYNIYDCLNLFTRREKLNKENAWYCSNCKDHKQADKKMEIYKAPQILILHLKRFKTNKVSSIGSFYFSSGSKKINLKVEFPIDQLDIRKFILGPDKEQGIYELFAISNHFGGLGGGHYTAFAKNYFNGKWFEFNDSSVSQAYEKELVTEAAYVLFYRRKQF